MADSKITALASIGTGTDPANDPLVIVDVSDVSPGGMSATGTTKKVTLNNLLACSPTATLASATITGDLTVDTNVLKVDTLNNRVGIGTASPTAALQVNLAEISSAAGTSAIIYNNTGGGNRIAALRLANLSNQWNIRAYGAVTDDLRFGSGAAGSEVDYLSIGNTGIFTWQNVGGVAGTAMTLNSTGLAIGATATGNRRLEVKSAGTSNTTFAAHFRDSADTLLFHVRSDGYFNTGQGALSPYNNTTASAANMYVDSSGFVYRSTSSLKYKADVKDSVHGLADVLKLRPVTYKAKNGDDTVFGGLIAEEVHAAGLTEFVAYAPDNTPDAIHYSNMVSLLVAAIKELTARVQTLETR